MLFRSLPCMRRIWIVSLMVVSFSLTGCSMWGKPKVETWKNTTSVEAMERLLWQEIKAGNWIEVEAHLASNYTSTTPSGVWDKSQTIDQWKKLALTDFSLGDFNIVSHGETTVVNYTLTMGGTASGRAMPATLKRRVAVWQKQKSGWVIISEADIGASPNKP